MPVLSTEPVQALPGLSFVPVGAHVDRNGVSFRVWAPDHENVRVVIGGLGDETRYIPLERDAEGFFSGHDRTGRAGDRYWYQIDEKLVADPASRFQPEGVDGPSQVIDPHSFEWTTRDWRRPALRGRVIYELHVGTFTPEGTFRAAMGRLDALADLGVNTIEIMPVAEFAGRWNWGYDGVFLFAPTRAYGPPDDLRALIDAAHARGLAVVLDVVYNHVGPCGNVLPALAKSYFHASGANLWGSALNFDGEGSAAVRQFFLQNACQWLDEFRVDGLRLDAVHAIEDGSERHIIAQIAEAARARGAFTIAEDERNDARIITPAARGGWGVDGMWSDDFHHAMRVAVTGERHAHFANYTGAIDEWSAALRDGWVYRGQPFKSWQGKPRGMPTGGLEPERFVFCISNHDQVGNRPLGDRLHDVVSLAAYRAVSMLLCLSPYTPLLFMGQEWAAKAPFPFFTDHPGEIGAKMRANRLKEFAHYNASYDEAMLTRMPDPQAEPTFRGAKLDWAERTRPPHAGVLELYRACLRLRAGHAIFQSPPRDAWEVRPLGDSAIAVRWREAAGDWLLRVAWRAGESRPAAADEAFLAPRGGRGWTRVLASEEQRFGGSGAAGCEAGGALRGPAAALWREA